MGLIITLSFFTIAALCAVVSYDKTKHIDLDIELIPGDLDNVYESFKVGSNVNVAGLIGTDFLDKYKYVIDFKRGKIFHNLHSVSFKEAMELLGIPYIVLWQNNRKYIFIIDTGSTYSHVSSEALKTLEYTTDNSKTFTTVGCGGNIGAIGLVKTKLSYK